MKFKISIFYFATNALLQCPIKQKKKQTKWEDYPKGTIYTAMFGDSDVQVL